MWITIPYIIRLYACRYNKQNHTSYYDIWRENGELFIRVGYIEIILTPYSIMRKEK
mgnify:CR=1 FL=1